MNRRAAVEQPDLLVIKDRLPSFTGPDVVRPVRELCPAAVIAVHVLDNEHLAQALDAGADGAFSRRTAPHEFAEGALQLLPDVPGRARPVTPTSTISASRHRSRRTAAPAGSVVALDEPAVT